MINDPLLIMKIPLKFIFEKMLIIELLFSAISEMKFGMKLKGGWNDCFKTLLKLSGYLIFIKDK